MGTRSGILTGTLAQWHAVGRKQVSGAAQAARYFASVLSFDRTACAVPLKVGCHGALILAWLSAALAADPKTKPLKPEYGVTGTFSIVAVDPETGECGAAVASMYPAVGKVVPYVRADVGAFCTQHWHNPPWGEMALDLLADGHGSEDVLAILLNKDPRRNQRQLAIIDMDGNAANRNPSGAAGPSIYWGCMSGRFYACQGNTLAGREVVTAMGAAYEDTKGSLTDRLMAALVAADCVGGDHRGRLAAGIRVAKSGVKDYWFELYVDESKDAVIDLLRKYVETNHPAKGDWSGGRAPFRHPCADRKK